MKTHAQDSPPRRESTHRVTPRGLAISCLTALIAIACHGEPTIVDAAPEGGVGDTGGSNVGGSAGGGPGGDAGSGMGGSGGARAGAGGVASSGGSGVAGGGTGGVSVGGGGGVTDAGVGGGTDASTSVDAGVDAASVEDAGSATPDAAPDPVCGNGLVEADEECDDGNDALNDPCDDLCRTQEKFYLVPLLYMGVELYDATGAYVRDLISNSASYTLGEPRNAVQIESGDVLVSERSALRISRWTAGGRFIEDFAIGLQPLGLDVRGSELLATDAVNGIRVFDLATGAATKLSSDTTLLDLDVLPSGWLLTTHVETTTIGDLQARTPEGLVVGVLADGHKENGGQITYLDDGRILWARGAAGDVVELLAPTGPPPADGGTRLDAGGVLLDIPSTAGRTVGPGGKAVGVVELDDGNWFITTSTGIGGVFDPDTNSRLWSNPSAGNRRFIEPFYARAECVMGPPGDGGIDGGSGDAGAMGCP